MTVLHQGGSFILRTFTSPASPRHLEALKLREKSCKQSISQQFGSDVSHQVHLAFAQFWASGPWTLSHDIVSPMWTTQSLFPKEEEADTSSKALWGAKAHPCALWYCLRLVEGLQSKIASSFQWALSWFYGTTLINGKLKTSILI